VRGVGRPLQASARALLEAQFGSRFADVWLHTGPHAAHAARQLGAAAFTLGRDIAFGQGFYAPHTGSGLRLLAHELAQVVQSQGAPARPLPAGGPVASPEPLKQEAERASDAFGRGPMVVQERLAGRMPLCHPVYISAHGDKGYLDMAAKFYANWGYTPVKTGVPSIEAILRDLAGQSSIDQVTIVLHANPDLMQIQFIDGGPEFVEKSDWQVDTGPELLTLDRHLVPATMLDQVLANAQQASPGVLPRIGPLSDPVRAPGGLVGGGRGVRGVPRLSCGAGDPGQGGRAGPQSGLPKPFADAADPGRGQRAGSRDQHRFRRGRTGRENAGSQVAVAQAGQRRNPAFDAPARAESQGVPVGGRPAHPESGFF
jgi:hypothetical protein